MTEPTLPRGDRPEPLQVAGLTVHYPGQREPAVEDVSVRVGEGEIVALVGPNGSGKSSVLNAILDLAPWRGAIRIFGEPFSRAWREIGHVPQQSAVDPAIPIRAAEMVRLPLEVRGVRDPASAVAAALADVGAAHLASRPLASLSGGERQRVLLARALAARPRLLLLDEPEAGVDAGGEQTLYGLLADLAGRGRLAALVATHDLDLVYRHTTRVVCIQRRMICSGPPAEVLTAEALQAMYGGLVTVYGHHHGAAPEPRGNLRG